MQNLTHFVTAGWKSCISKFWGLGFQFIHFFKKNKPIQLLDYVNKKTTTVNWAVVKLMKSWCFVDELFSSAKRRFDQNLC